MNKIITSKTNKKSHVYILKVFILDDKKTHHYPSFCIHEIEAFCFFSLEDCIVKMPHYIPDENLYCFVVEAHCCGVDMHFGTKERWLFLPDGTLYAHTFPGDEEIERNMEYDSLGTEDLIHLFSARTWALSFQPVSAEVQQMMRQWREYPRDVDVPIVAFGPDGMLFGQCTGKVTLVKTIVSPSMLHQDQVPVYESLRDCYHRKLRDYYPREEAEWLIGMEKDYRV